jgi:alcohol dehydrogenase class IV
VVSDDETHVKKIIFSPRLLAQRVFLDPDLTMALPASVTAATGMDALTHLVEAYLAKGFHPLGRRHRSRGAAHPVTQPAPVRRLRPAHRRGEKELLDDEGTARRAA